jgi:uncharacterized FlaG/YvyC family protein
MPDDLDSFDVGEIQGSRALKGLGEKRDQQKKGKQQQQDASKQSKDYIPTISRAVDASNEKLVRLNLPYRFSIYSEGDEVFINIVILDKSGKIVSEKKKNISHQEFARLMEDVSQIEGLFIDSNA